MDFGLSDVHRMVQETVREFVLKEVAPVIKEYDRKQEPIPWVRIYKVPEYVYFPHKAHIRAELTCQQCHGKVETMDQVTASTGQSLLNDLLNLTGMPVTSLPLTMGWCVECHTEKKANLECTACHH